MPNDINLNITDDSGVLSLVDCAAYRTFVSEDWDYDGITAHFQTQMSLRSILVWHCGDGGGEYSVTFRDHITSDTGYREVVGAIEATSNRLHLVSYSALTMAAQFEDELLPSKHERDLVIAVEPGQYNVRIVQLYNPDKAGFARKRKPHFLIELALGQSAIWSNVAWAVE